MINIKKLVCNPFQENCYIVSDETLECIIIDCGAYSTQERQAVVDYIRNNNLNLTRLVLTHAHIDHNLGNNTIFSEFGVQPEVPIWDKDLMKHLHEQAELLLGLRLDYDFPEVKEYFDDKNIITFGNHKLTVVHTPGHTEGSVLLYCEEEAVVFSGDTLFKGSIGRTDLPGGSMFKMIQSIRLIAQLPDNITIYPGHGDNTTIGYEIAHNPYMDR